MARHQITPAWQTQRGPLVQAAGCAVGVPVAGAKVFGETRQNLWSNPPTNTQNGMALTSNADGSLTLNGTASEASYFYVDIYCLKPGARYTLSLGRSFNASISVQSYRDSGYIADSVFVAAWSTSASGTVSQDATKFRLMVQMNAGTTIDNATVRVMLNEGGTAQPWCPPGLSSVSELSIVAAGKNLAAKSSFDGTMKIDCHVEAGMPITVSFDAQAAKSYQMYFHDEQGVFSRPNEIDVTADAPGRVSQTITLTYDSASVRSYAENGKDEIANLMVEYGPSATAYEPPAVTTTPVDLDGHQLRSLPDGTRDVLTVDGSGAVSVEQATAELVLDGSGDESYYIQQVSEGIVATHALSPYAIDNYPQIWCDTLPASTTGKPRAYIANNGRTVYFLDIEGVTDAESFRTWLSQHPTTVIYPVVTPQTVALDPITPPSIPAADATLWAASDVPCELEATTWAASGAEQGRQQAALVKLAQQVRQQAETVAALAAQSLEA